MTTAMIWGAGGGIGHALAAQLTSQNWDVVAVTHRRHANLDELTPHVVEADVSSPYEVNVAVTTASQVVDTVDLWIYAVGDITSAKVADMDHQDWWRILNANLSGAYLATQASMPLLAADAHLIYLGAFSERLRLPGLSAYAAAKAGLEAFAEALGKEERKRRVTVIRPSAVETPLWDKVPMSLPQGAASAAETAQQIIEAHQTGQKGVVDLA